MTSPTVRTKSSPRLRRRVDSGLILEKLYTKIDDFFLAAQQAQPEEVCCRKGCTSCCHVDLSVFTAEAVAIRIAFEGLPAPVRYDARHRAWLNRHCVMLDPELGQCIIYPSRPMICRSQGLALFIDETVSHCSMNYQKNPPLPEHILTLELANELLVLSNRMAGGDGSRVSLSSIAMGW